MISSYKIRLVAGIYRVAVGSLDACFDPGVNPKLIGPVAAAAGRVQHDGLKLQPHLVVDPLQSVGLAGQDGVELLFTTTETILVFYYRVDPWMIKIVTMTEGVPEFGR